MHVPGQSQMNTEPVAGPSVQTTPKGKLTILGSLSVLPLPGAKLEQNGAGAPPEMIHNRLIGQSLPNCQAHYLSNMTTIFHIYWKWKTF